MTNLTYYYLPTAPNSRLYYLVQIINCFPFNEKITIIVKNDIQSKEIYSFLQTKCISSQIIKNKNDIVENNISESIVYIINENDIVQLDKIFIGTVISLYGSSSIEELKLKLEILQHQERNIMIELISKIDFVFVQTLYKYSEIQVQRFEQKGESILLENQIARVESFISYYVNKRIEFQIPNEIKKSYNNALALLDEKSKLSFLEDFFVWNCYEKIPLLDIAESFKKDKNTIKIIINKGIVDSLTKENITAYFKKIKDVIFVTVESIENDKTTLSIQGRALKVNNISFYLENNLFNDSISLGIEFIEEIESKSEDNKFFNNKSYGKKEYGEKGRFERKPYGNRDRGGYQKEGFDRRDTKREFNNGERREWRGGDRFKKDNNYYGRRNNEGGFSRGISSGNSYGQGGYQKKDNEFSPKSNFKPRRPSFENYANSSIEDKGDRKFSNSGFKSFEYGSHKSYDNNFKGKDRGRGMHNRKFDKAYDNKKSRYNSFEDDSTTEE